MEDCKLRAIRNALKIKRLAKAGRLLSSPNFVSFVILLIFVRGSSSEFEFAFLNLQGFDSGVESSCRNSELCSSPCRSCNPAPALSQSSLDHFAFPDSLDLDTRERLNPRCRARRFREQP